MTFPPLGSQLGVFGKAYPLESSFETVLDAVLAAGYGAVEAGIDSPPGFVQALGRRGLRYGGGHTVMAGLADTAAVIATMQASGCADVCNSGILAWSGRTPAMYRDSIAELNRAGRELRRAGIRLHYHNHDFEFSERFDGRCGMDLLVEGLDPAACDLCVDVAWVQKGGEDPAAFLRRHAGLIGYLHLKDFDDAGWIELGQGKVDFRAIIAVLPLLTGCRWAMIEQDATALDPRDSVRISRSYLRETFGY